MQHLTMNLENISLKLIITDRHTVLEKKSHIWREYESSQEVTYSSKYFIYNYMEFVGYETQDKLLRTLGEGYRYTNTISKQGIPKR